MDDSKFEKWAALSGVVFIILAVVGAFIAGSPPKVSDTDVKIIKFVKDNQDNLKIGSYLAGLGTVFFLFFLGALWARLRKAEGGSGRLAVTALAGGLVALAITAVGSGVGAYGALHPLESAGTDRLSTVIFAAGGFAIAVFVEATSIVILRTKFLPAWMGWIGALIALGWLVSSAGVSTESDGIFVVGFVVFLAWALWLVILSVMLSRSTDSAPAAA